MSRQEGLEPLFRQITRIGRFKWYRRRASRTQTIKLVEIYPNAILRATPRPLVNRNRWQDLGLFVPGKWDHWSTQPFEERLLFRSVKQRYLERKDWEETQLYQTVMQEISKFGHSYSYFGGHLETASDLFEQCERIDHLYQSIEEDGYKSQQEQGASKVNSVQLGEYIPILDEVRIDISRTGEPLFVDGQHRLSIAKILDIESIPALVQIQHAQSPDEFEAVLEIDLETY